MLGVTFTHQDRLGKPSLSVLLLSLGCTNLPVAKLGLTVTIDRINVTKVIYFHDRVFQITIFDARFWHSKNGFSDFARRMRINQTSILNCSREKNIEEVVISEREVTWNKFADADTVIKSEIIFVIGDCCRISLGQCTWRKLSSVYEPQIRFAVLLCTPLRQHEHSNNLAGSHFDRLVNENKKQVHKLETRSSVRFWRLQSARQARGNRYSDREITIGLTFVALHKLFCFLFPRFLVGLR